AVNAATSPLPGTTRCSSTYKRRSGVTPIDFRRRGILFIVSAPSGAGKTTISGRASREIEGLEVSVSATTRAPRPGEIDGREYAFLERGEFESRLARGEFAESAE